MTNGSFQYVFVPCDVNQQMKELTCKWKSGEEVECLTRDISKHISNTTKAMTQAQKNELRVEITKQMKQPMEIDDNMLNMMASRCTVDITAMYPNRSQDKFIGINMYCDDSGKIKDLPTNIRASQITNACGKPTQVFGDAFFARAQDDGRDLFERMDMTMADITSDAAWIKTAYPWNIKEGKAHVEGMKMMQLNQNKAAAKKAPPSEAAVQKWKLQLQKWFDGKMKQFDEDETFRSKRIETHKTREAFEATLRKKMEAQIKAKTQCFGD